MMIGDWEERRDDFIEMVSESELLSLVEEMSARNRGDEVNAGKRIDSVLWASSRGNRGYEWGHAGVAARALQLFGDRYEL